MEPNVIKNVSASPADQLRELVGKAEELLVTLGEGGDSTVAQLRARVRQTVHGAQQKLGSLEAQAQDIASRSVRGTDTYVRSNPWTSVAVAAAAGALIGALVSRRF